MEPQVKEKLLSDAFSFLQEQTMGAISTIASDNTPESACVNYLLDTDWKIYIITNNASRKVQNIKQNNHVAFVVGVAQIPHTVQIQADSEILEMGTDEYDKALVKLNDSKRLNRDPIYNIFGSDYVILKLNITWLRWLYFDSGTGKGVYTVLIP